MARSAATIRERKMIKQRSIEARKVREQWQADANKKLIPLYPQEVQDPLNKKTKAVLARVLTPGMAVKDGIDEHSACSRLVKMLKKDLIALTVREGLE